MREIFRTKLRERWICYEPGHDLCYRAPDNDQHLLLSGNHVEFWVDELCNGNTSYHELPAFGTIPWSSTNTTSNLREGVDELPPLRLPGVLSSEQWDQNVSTGMREIFRAKIRERWSCNETGHNLCYRAPDDDHHIPLSLNDVEFWVDEFEKQPAMRYSGRNFENGGSVTNAGTIYVTGHPITTSTYYCRQTMWNFGFTSW
ncbi:hypothetical protein BU17DRAFT_66255 [Hysterangium stoloniferum]|nr:hypothetical protein BU17DRAFT_66255 [Hysterangium stoloniferum]